MSQVAEELANIRQEAEKLSTENESLNKNYESLLKVTRLFVWDLYSRILLFFQFKGDAVFGQNKSK